MTPGRARLGKREDRPTDEDGDAASSRPAKRYEQASKQVKLFVCVFGGVFFAGSDDLD